MVSMEDDYGIKNMVIEKCKGVRRSVMDTVDYGDV